jgi:phage shock protein A
MRIIARVQNLLRGVLAHWIGRRERRNPEAVYEAAIQERLDQYAKLRAAAAGVLYMRSKLGNELRLAAEELARLGRQLEIAVDQDDDAAALALIGRRDTLQSDVERLTAELTELESEADGAKKNLIAFQSEIARLRDEKVRMLARLANAKARLRLQTTLNGLSPDADIRALEGVRDHINQLVAETQVSRDLGDRELERRLGRIREAEADSARRAQLDELKRSRKRGFLPMVVAPEVVPQTDGRAAEAVGRTHWPVGG